MRTESGVRMVDSVRQEEAYPFAYVQTLFPVTFPHTERVCVCVCVNAADLCAAGHLLHTGRAGTQKKKMEDGLSRDLVHAILQRLPLAALLRLVDSGAPTHAADLLMHRLRVRFPTTHPHVVRVLRMLTSKEHTTVDTFHTASLLSCGGGVQHRILIVPMPIDVRSAPLAGSVFAQVAASSAEFTEFLQTRVPQLLPWDGQPVRIDRGFGFDTVVLFNQRCTNGLGVALASVDDICHRFTDVWVGTTSPDDTDAVVKWLMCGSPGAQVCRRIRIIRPSDVPEHDVCSALNNSIACTG